MCIKLAAPIRTSLYPPVDGHSVGRVLRLLAVRFVQYRFRQLAECSINVDVRLRGRFHKSDPVFSRYLRTHEGSHSGDRGSSRLCQNCAALY